MLQAITEDGELLTLARFSRKQVLHVKRQAFYCPHCKEQVIVRAGEKVIPHFAHQADSTCATGQRESNYHRKGKLILYEWLLRQHIQVELEKHLPEINQRPDLYIQINDKKIVIEYQCAKVDANSIRKRNSGYEKLGITPIWILGAKRFKRLGKQKIKIDFFTHQFIHQFRTDRPNFLLYLCPFTQTLSISSDLYFTNQTQSIAQISFRQIASLTFPQLFPQSFIPKQSLYTLWSVEKRKFRLSGRNSNRYDLPFRQWLYQKRLYIERLPAIIHLPVPYQHQANLPLWMWQSYLIIDFLDPLPIGSLFSLQQVNQFLASFLQEDPTPLKEPQQGQAYLDLLHQLGVTEKLDRCHYRKLRAIRFFTHIEEALKGDETVIRRLMKTK